MKQINERLIIEVSKCDALHSDHRHTIELERIKENAPNAIPDQKMRMLWSLTGLQPATGIPG